MKRKTLLLLLLLAGMCNVLVAQKLKTEYYYQGFSSCRLLSSKYTTLPDGTPHGKHYQYNGDDDGLYYLFEWDHGKLVGFTHYLEDGKTVDYQASISGVVATSALIYDKGEKLLQYEMKSTPNVQYYYGTEGLEFLMKSYSGGGWQYTLASNGTQADIKNTEMGAYYTYDFTKEELTIHESKKGFEMDHANVIVTNNIAYYEITEDVDYVDNGYIYTLTKGTKGQFEMDKACDKRLFGETFFGWFPFKADFSSTDMGILFDVDYSGTYYALAVFNQPRSIELPTEHLQKEHTNARTGMIVNFNDQELKLSLVTGDIENGECEGNDMKATIVDGKIGSFTYNPKYSYCSYSASVVKSTYNNGIATLEIVEGTKTDNGTIYQGTFENNELVEGTKKKGKSIFVGTFNNGVLIKGSYQTTDNGTQFFLEGEFDKNGYLVEGTRKISYSNGNTKTYIGEWKGNNNGFSSGSIEIEVAENNDLYLYANKNYSLNAKYLKGNTTDEVIRLEKKNGDIFEGSIPSAYWKSMFNGTRFESLQGQGSVIGKYSLANGNSIEGNISCLVLAFGVDRPSDIIKGKINIGTEFGRYIGEYENETAVGKGKMVINGLGEVSGEFDADILRTDVESEVDLKFPTGETYKGQMLGGKFHGIGELRFSNGDYYIGEFVNGKFSGTGTVRYTHSKGVFEGKVENFVCQYDTPQEKNALKKINAPKVPKVKLPSKVGKWVL